MRTDFPATESWLDLTATRCAHSLGVFAQSEISMLREVLTGALADFPQASLDAEFMADLRGGLARSIHDSMTPEAWVLWRRALQLYRQVDANVKRNLPVPGDTPNQRWLSASLAWYEAASGTTLNQPVRLVLQRGRPRDMVVTNVEVMCDPNDIEGRAVLIAHVYRPPKTSSCQVYFPGDQLRKLEWSALPASALFDRKSD